MPSVFGEGHVPMDIASAGGDPMLDALLAEVPRHLQMKFAAFRVCSFCTGVISPKAIRSGAHPRVVGSRSSWPVA
eukprot:12225318-Alexandrium_andersonii.AAC.1